MNGFSFDNFIVHDTNREAYKQCRQIAAAEKSLPCPIVLLGESASGKTHLLRAIVHDLRARDAKVGVALISAQEFPDKVKNLPDNPKKLNREYPAILIVDDLHQFEAEDLQALERVMLAFKEYGQHVVVGSRIHPNVLPSLGAPIRSFLNSGTLLFLASVPDREQRISEGVNAEKIAALKTRIAGGNGDSGAEESLSRSAGKEITMLRQELQKIKHERDVLRTALERSEGELVDMRVQLAQERVRAREKAATAAQQLDESEKAFDLAVAQDTDLQAARQEEMELLAVIDEIFAALEGCEGQLPEAVEAHPSASFFESLQTDDSLNEDVPPDEEESSPSAFSDSSPIFQPAGPNKARKTLATIAQQIRALEEDSASGENQANREDA